MRWEAKVMDRETIKRQIQLYHSDCLVGMEPGGERKRGSDPLRPAVWHYRLLLGYCDPV